MMFGFDDRYAMFDVTPVDNQFIQEYLPSAKGDYVRVYLYGLMRCYHPEADMSPVQMARELSLEEEEILAAFRYWERRGLVRRISDNPVSYQYINIRQKALAGTAEVDPEFEAFTDSLYEIFGHERRLHGGEIQMCYEWVENLGLPREAVIMLLRQTAKNKGMHFSIASAGKTATQMAREGVKTLEDAEAFLSRDEEAYQAVKKILRRMGRRNNPSEDQMEMYRKWIREWGFTPEAIEKACAETAKGDPSMGYLDGILRRIHERGAGGEIDEAAVARDQATTKKLRDVLNQLGQWNVNDPMRDWLSQLQSVYPADLIELAARECGRTGGNTEDVERMLASWRKKGIQTRADAERYVAGFRADSEVLLELRKKWGLNGRMGEKDRKLLSSWQKELGFSPEMILFIAGYAADSNKPMQYLDKVLRSYAEKGIRTREAAEREHEAHRQESLAAERKRKPDVPAQDYEQRDYSQETETIDDMMARLNGGVIPHA